MKKFELVSGPFDGVVLELPDEVDRITLECAHVLPGEVVNNGPELFQVYPNNKSVYEADMVSEEELNNRAGWPLYYVGKESGEENE